MPRFATANNVSSYTRRAGGIGGILSDAIAALGTAPLHYWDFLNNRAMFNSIDVGAVTSTPGWSYTRADAQSAYAQDLAGNLIPFATGVLRRTDKGVLIEGARTNLCLQSQTFDNASWTKSGAGPVAVTANTAVAPDGTTTADTIAGKQSLADRVQQTLTVSAATVYTFSVYVKNIDMTETVLNPAITGGASATIVWSGATISNITVTSCTATSRALGNGWYLVAMTYTTGGADTSIVHRIYPDNGAASSTLRSGYFWGAQVETGSFVTSYIPTTTASATRAADVLTVSSPGVTYPLSLFAETQLDDISDAATSRSFLQIDAGSQVDRSLLYGTPGAGTASRAYVSTASVQQAGLAVGTLVAGIARKSAMRVATNSVQLAGAGTLATEDTLVTVPATPSRLIFGNENTSGGTPLFGYIRRAAVFSSALNDAQLQRAST